MAEQPLELRQTAAACRLEQTTDHGQGGGAAAAAAGSSVGNLALGLKSARQTHLEGKTKENLLHVSNFP